MPNSANAEQARTLLEEHHQQIENLLRATAYRQFLPPEEFDDFAGWTWTKLLENDCRIIRRFQHESEFLTFLHTVLANLARDYRNKLFGKWRASKAAERLGTTAMELERLIYRARCTPTEAAAQLRAERGSAISTKRFSRLLAQLPPRRPLRPIGPSTEDEMCSTGGVENGLRAEAAHDLAHRVTQALRGALAALPEADRELLKLQFKQRLSVAEIARRSGQNQRRLYPLLSRALKQLRQSLLASGIEVRHIRQSLADKALVSIL